MSWLTVSQPASPLRAAAVLTNSEVATSSLEVKNQNQVCILVSFTKGSLTNMLLRTQLSFNNSDWFDYEIDDTANVVTSGTDLQIPARSLIRVFDGDCTLGFQVPVKAAYLRFKVVGTGTATGSSCTITAMLGVA